METKTKKIFVLSICFSLLIGCAPQNDIIEILQTNTAAAPTETESPIPSPTTSPTETSPSPSVSLTTTNIIPSATSSPTESIQTPTITVPQEAIYVGEGEPVPQPEEVIGIDNAAQLVELARWGYGEINQVIHTQNGQLMLVQTDVGVYAYQVGTLNEVWRFQPENVITGLEVSENGGIRVGGYGRLIYIVDQSDGSLEETASGTLPEPGDYLPGEPLSREDSHINPDVIDAFFEQVEVPEGLPFRGISPNGKYFVFAGESSVVVAYRVSDFSLILLFDPYNSLSNSSPHDAAPNFTSGVGADFINSVVFNHSESYLVGATFDGQLFFFDLERGELNVSTHGNGSRLMIPPYSNTVILLDQDTIEVFAIPSGERTASINHDLSGAWRLLYSPGGTRLAMGTTLWNTDDGTFLTMPENELVIGFSENGSYVYSIRQGPWWVERRTDNLVLHWQTSLEIEDTDHFTEWEIRTIFLSGAFWSYESENNEITAYSPGPYDPTWDTQTGMLVELPDEDLMPDILWTSALSPDGAVHAEISDNVLVLSNNLTGEIMARFNLSLWELARVAFSPDGRYLTVASFNGVVRIFGVPPSP